MRIRLAVAEDIAELHRLLAQVHEVHALGRPDLFKPGATKYTTVDLQELLDKKDTVVLVAQADNAQTGQALIGYGIAWIEDQKDTASHHAQKNLYIDDLCVDQTQRGQGAGKALYQALCEEARKRGCNSVTLHCWACNDNAYTFYKALGMDVRIYTFEHLLEPALSEAPQSSTHNNRN